MIGLYHGHEKPNIVNAFLEDFVNEAQDVVSNGIEISDKGVIPVEITGICCDAPANPSALQAKGRSGRFSCTRCKIEGKYVNGRVSFNQPHWKKNPPRFYCAGARGASCGCSYT
jgi:hypothetical protein